MSTDAGRASRSAGVLGGGLKYDPYPRQPTAADFTETHRYVLEDVPEGVRVLELGCATGYLGKFLTRDKGCRVVGVELDANAAELCRDTYEGVVVADLNDAAGIEWENLGVFDVVIASAVLEHLIDPELVLKLACARLTQDGVAVVNLPNVGHWTVRKALLFGKWEYTDYGILDRTHLRFYTLRSARELLTARGLEIERTRYTYGPRPLLLRAASLVLGGRAFRDRVSERFPGVFAKEMIFRARLASSLAGPGPHGALRAPRQPG